MCVCTGIHSWRQHFVYIIYAMCSPYFSHADKNSLTLSLSYTQLLLERQNNDKPYGLANMLIVYHAKLQNTRWLSAYTHAHAHTCT